VNDNPLSGSSDSSDVSKKFVVRDPLNSRKPNPLSSRGIEGDGVIDSELESSDPHFVSDASRVKRVVKPFAPKGFGVLGSDDGGVESGVVPEGVVPVKRQGPVFNSKKVEDFGRSRVASETSNSVVPVVESGDSGVVIGVEGGELVVPVVEGDAALESGIGIPEPVIHDFGGEPVGVFALDFNSVGGDSVAEFSIDDVLGESIVPVVNDLVTLSDEEGHHVDARVLSVGVDGIVSALVDFDSWREVPFGSFDSDSSGVGSGEDDFGSFYSSDGPVSDDFVDEDPVGEDEQYSWDEESDYVSEGGIPGRVTPEFESESLVIEPVVSDVLDSNSDSASVVNPFIDSDDSELSGDDLGEGEVAGVVNDELEGDSFVGSGDDSLVGSGDSLSREPFNPFVDDDGVEYSIDVSGLSGGDSRFVERDEDDSDGVFEGFDSQLDQVLSDDEDAVAGRVSSSESGEGESEIIVSDEPVEAFNPFVGDDEGDFDESGDSFVEEVVDSRGRVSEPGGGDNPFIGSDSDDLPYRPRLVDGVPERELLPEGALNLVNRVRETSVEDRERIQAAREKGSLTKSGVFDSDFSPKRVTEVVVDSRGRGKTRGKDPLVRGEPEGEGSGEEFGSPSDWVGATPVRERQRYQWTRGDGRLNGKELEFFRNLELSKSEFQRRGDSAVLLRKPAGGNESEAERKERVKRLTRAIGGREALERGTRFRFGWKEREVLEFLAMFRYATAKHLSRMFSEAESTMYKRLKKLRLQGLVIDKKLYGARPIWFLTEAGLVVSGFDLPRVIESKLTFSMFPHQFTVNNTAANLWGANVDVLHLDNFPERNREDEKGNPRFGEKLVSELEIQSSFGKLKMFDKSDVYRPQIIGLIEREFAAWEEAGGVEFGPSPEQVYGNEYMWALMPPYNVKLAYHVPDLVVKRPRNSDGTPNSIAVEIEINNKPSASYEKTLRAYLLDSRLYSKVIWVCKNVGPARKLEKIGKDLGMLQSGKLNIVPVLTEDGVFKERDLWTL